MRAYMKSAMPFLGVPAPARARVLRTAGAATDFRANAAALWDAAEFREERYVALALLERHRRELELADLPLLARLIVERAWWDYVDELAHRVGDLRRRHPAELAATMREWSRDENLWKRRVSIICQVGHKAETDLPLLYDCIAPNLADREFFIRKAIGWALRDYAWTDPAEIGRYVREHESELTGLSRREATKNLARLLA
jgi:3-methyladenine DNA glycosylase AlkD